MEHAQELDELAVTGPRGGAAHGGDGGLNLGGGKVAGDAVYAGAVLPVRRQIDLDHGIAEPGSSDAGGGEAAFVTVVPASFGDEAAHPNGAAVLGRF